MQADRSKVLVAAAGSGLHHEVEPDLIERLASRAVVEPAQGNSGFIVLPPERSFTIRDGNVSTASAASAPHGNWGYLDLNRLDGLGCGAIFSIAGASPVLTVNGLRG
jgi:hypothetical protein